MATTTDGGVHAIVHVDLMPDRRVEGTNVLVAFVREARRGRPVGPVALVQQASAPNHYVIDMTFVDQDPYRWFVQEPYVRDFRTALFPHLGSPWDERLGSDVVA